MGALWLPIQPLCYGEEEALPDIVVPQPGRACSMGAALCLSYTICGVGRVSLHSFKLLFVQFSEKGANSRGEMYFIKIDIFIGRVSSLSFCIMLFCELVLIILCPSEGGNNCKVERCQ